VGFVCLDDFDYSTITYFRALDDFCKGAHLLRLRPGFHVRQSGEQIQDVLN
jgi:hypothetical protein